MSITTTIDEAKVEAFLGQLVTEAGAAMNAALVRIGDELGLYRAMADSQPVSAAGVAVRTQTHERYVREWLNAQAAGGFVTYDPQTDRYALPAEHAIALADELSPLAQAGVFQAVTAAIRAEDRVIEAFRTGDGIGWHEQHHGMFHGTERAFATSYRTSLMTEWIPALDGVEDKLRTGARVADVGCGHGVSTVLLAQAYPSSTICGIDYHNASIERARALAEAEGVAANTEFAVAGAKDYPGTGYDLVCFFDCLHDMGDPVGALKHVRETLDADGTVMLVEPFANDTLADNLNPVGRIYYAASTLICTPSSLDQEVGLGLGAQAGGERLRAVAEEAGFTRFRQATATPFNLVLEARP
jgi:2-polyprenyl-3-methyl-5-hydroxy-6-metoxy-1,4-benzoquinol methylase